MKMQLDGLDYELTSVTQGQNSSGAIYAGFWVNVSGYRRGWTYYLQATLNNQNKIEITPFAQGEWGAGPCHWQSQKEESALIEWLGSDLIQKVIKEGQPRYYAVTVAIADNTGGVQWLGKPVLTVAA